MIVISFSNVALVAKVSLELLDGFDGERLDFHVRGVLRDLTVEVIQEEGARGGEEIIVGPSTAFVEGASLLDGREGGSDSLGGNAAFGSMRMGARYGF